MLVNGHLDRPNRKRFRRIGATLAVLLVGAGSVYWYVQARSDSSEASQALVRRYCLDCHNSTDLTADLSFEHADFAHVGQNPDVWEKVIRKLRAGMMPPADRPQPGADQRAELVSWLERRLDRAAAASPDPGPSLLRRMNRAEYANAVRDLLHVDIDSKALLPPDDSAYGFDNIADALGTSPVLVEQYLSAAGKIAALAVGDRDAGPAAQTFKIPQDESQTIPVIGMPLGTVGGGVAHVVLPLDGEYRLDVTFFKSNLGAMKGVELPHQIEIAVDGERVHLASIGGPEDFAALMKNITEAADAISKRSSTTAKLTAGEHDITVGFLYDGATLGSMRLQPFLRSSQDILDVTGHPHIQTLTVTGPYNPTGLGKTASRDRIFVCHPASAGEERRCASEILSQVARRAYRGMDTEDDLNELLAFYESGHEQRGFEGGIQTAIERALSSPKFLFRIERDPPAAAPGATYPLPDVELASRLSFFLWSSIPDDELLDLAHDGKLANPKALKAQVVRMLADPKAHALVDNFAGQWLYLRNLDSFQPNSSGFPNFDDNLRQGLKKETELFFESIVKDDRSVVDLMTANYTFLNERVAKHYGIPGVYGPQFRRVELTDEVRWGLLGKGSVLMVSSHTDRTSPVVRGKWVLDNVLGTPPPAPPANVPKLDEIDPKGVMSLRQRLEAHRKNPVCASCHATMDPIGFALENFDAVGAYRDYEKGIGSTRVDASGRLADGTVINGAVELRHAILRNPEIFVSTVVQKLMTYALGRGLSGRDMAVVRSIVRDTAKDDYRFSSVVLAVAESVPFRERKAAGDGTVASVER
jgi:Protein of unknown function (DUF1592)/Protein of unknown function (DUF1588)/Protein of unknown function (DUF1587)/Protein of unknown function (DUF1585)/Protein of unknown function (DUF1595)/Planctomycete cytochrome C